jgi:hypothetical protein
MFFIKNVGNKERHGDMSYNFYSAEIIFFFEIIEFKLSIIQIIGRLEPGYT